MGTICAPNYANIFMAKFEKTYIYPYINQISNFYCRFIDDIFFIWNGTVIQLQEFIKKLNNRHPTIKFDFKFSKTNIEFLDTTVHKNKEQNKLLTTVYCKPTDRRNFLHYTSAHPRSLIKSIPYSQALRLKKICAETSKLSKNLQVLKESFINRGFKEKFLDTEFQRLSEIERDALLTPKSKEKDQKRIPFITTYNKTLPNLKQIINKHWHLLQINSNLRTAFEQEPLIAYRRNKNFGDLIGSKKMLDGRVVRENNSKKQLYCRPCLTRRDNICCEQVLKTNTFTNYRTGETFKIFHQLNCKSSHLIYLLQCRICQLQYVGKSETSFNIRLNNHRKDSKNKNTILACKNFQKSNHNFQRDAKFALIEQITKSFTTTEQLRLLLKIRKYFWILKLKTLYPDGLN